ncbi:MAG: hypothetical protein Q8N69_01660 [bacterium]|nr:hypothetical protein [bacterium]
MWKGIVAIVLLCIALICVGVGSLCLRRSVAKRIEFLEHKVSGIVADIGEPLNSMLTIMLVDTDGKVIEEVRDPTYIRLMKTPDGYWVLHSMHNEFMVNEKLRAIRAEQGNEETKKYRYLTSVSLPRQ